MLPLPSLVCKQWKKIISFSKCLFPELMSHVASTGRIPHVASTATTRDVPSTIGSFEDPGAGCVTHTCRGMRVEQHRVRSCVLSSDTSIRAASTSCLWYLEL